LLKAQSARWITGTPAVPTDTGLTGWLALPDLGSSAPSGLRHSIGDPCHVLSIDRPADHGPSSV
jgi:hypothetical protein